MMAHEVGCEIRYQVWRVPIVDSTFRSVSLPFDVAVNSSTPAKTTLQRPLQWKQEQCSNDALKKTNVTPKLWFGLASPPVSSACLASRSPAVFTTVWRRFLRSSRTSIYQGGGGGGFVKRSGALTLISSENEP